AGAVAALRKAACHRADGGRPTTRFARTRGRPSPPSPLVAPFALWGARSSSHSGRPVAPDTALADPGSRLFDVMWRARNPGAKHAGRRSIAGGPGRFGRA